MSFPQTRMRRLRATAGLRGLVRETDVRADQLVLPLFVAEADVASAPESGLALPGLGRLSISAALDRAREAADLGSGAVLLFGVPAHKDPEGSGAYDEEGVVQMAMRAIKQALPDGPLVITDVCLCEYTDPRPLRRAAESRPAARLSTTTPRSSCSRVSPSATRAPAPTSWRRRT